MTEATLDIAETPPAGFLSPSRLKIVALLALPILATMLTQNLMQVVDTLMIGQLGDEALAGVSIAGNQFFTLFSLMLGINAGVQMMVARRVGEGRPQSAPLILNAGLLLGGSLGLVLVGLGYSIIPSVINAVSPEPVVAEQATNYLFTIMPSALFAGLAVAMGGFWIGMSRPAIGFFALFIQLVCNVAFNYVLIFGKLGMPRMEIAGAGLGTTLANVVGVATHLLFAFYFIGGKGFLRRLPDKDQIKTLVTVSVPVSIQQFSFTLGMAIFVFIVGMLGTPQLAAFQVIIVIMMTLFMMAMGLGATATTLVSGALGRKQPANAAQWGWEISTLGAGVLLLIGIVFFVFAEDLLHAFISEPETVAIALVPMRITMALVGAGAVGPVFVISFTNQWFLRLPLYAIVGIALGYGLVGIFVAMLAMYVLQTLLFIGVWRRGNWREITV